MVVMNVAGTLRVPRPIYDVPSRSRRNRRVFATSVTALGECLLLFAAIDARRASSHHDGTTRRS